MEMWDNNPFVHYNIKKYNNHFKLQKKVVRVNCEKCKSRACNSHCSFKLCLKCCIGQTIESSGTGNCKVKAHRVAIENDRIHDIFEDVVDDTE